MIAEKKFPDCKNSLSLLYQFSKGNIDNQFPHKDPTEAEVSSHEGAIQAKVAISPK